MTAREIAQNIIGAYSDCFSERKDKDLIIDVERSLLEAEREGMLRAAALFTDDIEAASAEAHEAYQVEAHRRGDVRHDDDYYKLKESTKEWDRVLVRWVADKIRTEAEKIETVRENRMVEKEEEK